MGGKETCENFKKDNCLFGGLIIFLIILSLFFVLAGTMILDESEVFMDAILDDVVSETGDRNFSHLIISNTAPYDSLVLYISFDSNASNTTIYDYTNYGNDGTITNASYNLSGLYGGSMDFDGDDDFILFGDEPFDIDNNLTISAWIRHTGDGDSYQQIIGRRLTEDYSYGLRLDNNEKLSFLTTGGSLVGTVVTKNQWQHVAVTFRDGNTTLYKNGTVDASSVGLSITNNNIALRMGDRGNLDQSFNGTIDEVMIFNASLNDSQISDIYNNQSARFKSEGEFTLNNQTYLNISLGYDRVNVSTNLENNLGTNISLRVRYYNGTGWFLTDPQNITDSTNYTFNISTASTNLTLNYTFLSDSNQFYTPLIKGDIVFDLSGFNTLILYDTQTESDDSKLSQSFIYVNVTLIEGDFENMSYTLYNETIPLEDLLFYYNFDRSLTNLRDLSGNGFNTTVILGAVYNASGKLNGAYEFDGSDDHINVSSSIIPKGDYSERTWQLTPTFDGSNSSIHPSVIYVDGGWNSYTYWMAITPYFDATIGFENPSILASNDAGESGWEVPAGLSNPINSSAANTFYSDPDIVYHSGEDMMYVYWDEANSTGKRMWMVNSSDGVDWGAQTQVLSNGSVTTAFVSPAVVYNGSGNEIFEMWTILATPDGCSNTNNFVEYRNSTDGITWNGPFSTTITFPDTMNPWHIDVDWIDSENEYWMVYNAFVDGDTCSGSRYLMFANSSDGLTWTASEHPFYKESDNSSRWDSNVVYRPTFVYNSSDETLDVWYSGLDSWGLNVRNNDSWRTGRLDNLPKDRLRNPIEYTLCLWVNADSVHNGGIFGNRYATDQVHFINLGLMTSNKIQFNCKREGSLQYGEPNANAYVASEWFFLCGVINTTGVFLYKNDSFLLNGTTSGYAYECQFLNIDSRPLRMATYHTGASSFMFNGKLEEVMFFNKSLSESEINSLYKRSVVNHTTYATRTYGINWTGLTDNGYHYFVDLLDGLNNYNFTAIRQINLTAFSVTVNSPRSTVTYSTGLINFNVTLNREGYCEYSVTSGRVNLTMDSSDNLTFYDSSYVSEGHPSVDFYCNDTVGNRNYAESISFTTLTVKEDSPRGGSGTPSSVTNTIVSDAEKFEKSGVENVKLSENERVMIKVSGENHFVRVVSLGKDSAIIGVSSKLQRETFSVGEEKKFDVNGDDWYDLSIKLNSISGLKADLTIKSIRERISAGSVDGDVNKTDVNGSVGDNDVRSKLSSKEKSIWTREFLIGVILVVVIFVVVIVFDKVVLRKKR